MGYIPEVSDRSKAFDSTIVGALAIVDSLPPLAAFHPQVRPAVAALGDMIGQLFLPNITDQGVAEVPSSRLATDGYGFIPLVHPAETIRYGGSFRVCTPRRKALTAEHYRMRQSRLSLLFLNFAYDWPYDPIPLDESESQGGTTAIDAHIAEERKTIHVSSRPLITLQPETPAKGLIHEAIHAYDLETEFLPPKLSVSSELRLAVRRELRAYHVGYTIANARQHTLGYDPIGDDFDAYVERLRLGQPWPWRTGFRPNRRTISTLEDSGAVH